MSGYNLEYIDNIYKNILAPLTLLGGAGEVDHFKDVIKKLRFQDWQQVVFFYKKRVLINYTNKKTIF